MSFEIFRGETPKMSAASKTEMYLQTEDGLKSNGSSLSAIQAMTIG
jgi:hypothetical protein